MSSSALDAVMYVDVYIAGTGVSAEALSLGDTVGTAGAALCRPRKPEAVRTLPN